MPGLASLASKLGGKLSDSKTRGAFLIGLQQPNDAIEGTSVRFQYFPETFSDTKSVNYQTKEVPGGSLPIYQWISSGERTISFNAFFSSDVDLLLDTVVDDPKLPSAIAERLKAIGVAGRNVDIRAAIAWLRQYLFPNYDSARTHAPNKLRLFIPGSGIGVAGGSPDGAVSPDAINCVMTQCEVSYDAFFPTGLPRLATVQIVLAQTAQTGGVVRFPASTYMDSWASLYSGAFKRAGT